jgi:DNA (cytosine-5)-methyltransferase 1
VRDSGSGGGVENMKYGSVCSGIEAASVAWHPLGWRASFLSEIEAFPRAVLSHHYPEVPLHGDFTTIRKDQYEPIDLLVGGTPCQSFSIAGLRGGLADDRGNLALEYLKLAQRTRPRWLVWENVPGVLSSAGGRDFGAILGGMVELGYGLAYRVLDAQHLRVDGFGRAVPQRRRRVFVVGHLGDWRRAAAVLFERESLSGNSAPRREAGEGIAERAKDGPGDRRWPALVAPTLNAAYGDKMGLEDQHALSGGGMFVPDYANSITAHNGARNEVSDILNGAAVVEVASTLSARPTGGGGLGTDFDLAGGAIAIQERAICENLNAGPDGAGIRTDGAAYTLEARTVPQAVQYGWRVRRLTPTECERLQGFPDGYTDIPWRNKEHSPDGPRYKALGNSMAVNAMRWIGRRIEMVEANHV